MTKTTPAPAMKKEHICPIDGFSMEALFKHKILGKYIVDYFICAKCGVIQTQTPFWHEEAYSSPISALDTWGAARNVWNARRLSRVLNLLFNHDDSFVDVACGYGLFVRLMRDKGFDFHGHDDFCPNLFSRCLPALRNPRPAAITCFEVLEHVVDPVRFVSDVMDKHSADTMIASTTLFERVIPDFSWPYYSFESGQHVTLYQEKSLRALAARLGLSYTRLDIDLHLFSRRSFNAFFIKALQLPRVRAIVGLVGGIKNSQRSLTVSDYEFIRQSIDTDGSSGIARAD